MKKAIALVLVLVIALSMTACDSTDYKEAMGLYEAGEFEAARTMFIALGDYEDSALMVKKCGYALAQHYLAERMYTEAEAELTQLGDYEDSAQLLAKIPFKKLYNALEEGGEVTVTESSTATRLSAENGAIFAGYVMKLGVTGMLSTQITVVVQLNEDGTAIVAGESSAKSYAADEEVSCKGKLDIASYKKGDEITWDTFDCSGYNANGPVSRTNSTMTILGGSSVGNAIGALSAYLAGSELGITMEDLGFTSFE